MKKMSVTVLAVLFCASAFASPTELNGLYVNTFGNSSKSPLLFVHGGPGDDSSLFESSDAALLAAQGYFVVVYDQRGQGRSVPATQEQGYDYATYSNDIKSIIDLLKLKNPVLLAHSHGGSVAAHFDSQYPGIVDKIILVDAPVDLWKMVGSIQDNCDVLYLDVGDSAGSAKMSADVNIISSDSSLISNANILPLASGVIDFFASAGSCGRKLGLYATQMQTQEAKLLYQQWFDFVSKNVTPNTSPQNMAGNAVYGFLENENYLHVDFSAVVRTGASHYFGIYGDEDGLFNQSVLDGIKILLGSGNGAPKFQIIKGASHNIFVDQREAFNTAVLSILQSPNSLAK